MSTRRAVETYRVSAGTFRRFYFTEYHAEQMARALRLHGMDPKIERVNLPADPLTRLTVSP
jgi:hypothetical protein